MIQFNAMPLHHLHSRRGKYAKTSKNPVGKKEENTQLGGGKNEGGHGDNTLCSVIPYLVALLVEACSFVYRHAIHSSRRIEIYTEYSQSTGWVTSVTT